jgi:hypothetical protein
MKQFLHYLKITLALVLFLQVGEMSGQNNLTMRAYQGAVGAVNVDGTTLNQVFGTVTINGTSLNWYSDNTRTNLVANPTLVATSGTYFAFYFNAATNCFSPASAGVTVTVANCCTTPPSVN